MKKILTLALAIAMLVSFGSVFAVSAEEPTTFWLTHYGDNTVEGSGVIFTEAYEGAVWWIHFAFAPIEGAQNAYEIVATSNGLADGSATALAIPEGGFVWAANTGNDYPSLGMGDTDYTSPNCFAAIDVAKTWAVGDQFVISGVDFETIPTSTPDTLWYDDAYVCTATIAPYDPSATPEDPSEPEQPEDPSEPEQPSEPEVDEKALYEEEYAGLVGEAVEDSSFNIALDSTTDADGVVSVTVTVTDIAEGAELTGLFAYLYYDMESMTLTTEVNDENALECITKVPSEAWNENLVHIDKDEGFIDIGIGATTGDILPISEENPLVLTFTFQLKEGCEYAGVVIPNATVSASDINFADFKGTGAYEIVELPVVDEPSDEPSKPVTPGGDAGVIVFAVLGLIAICGAAVVVKVRH